jgi:choline dehydrogenase-like flavoprotein
MSDTYDYVVVGGGASGGVLAARLAEESDATVSVLEAGPTDEGRPEVLELPRWIELIGGELDYDYGIEPQPRANSMLRHSRARVLGGCSSHNACIAFRAPAVDMDAWAAAVASDDWGAEQTRAYFQRVLERANVQTAGDHNEAVTAFLQAGSEAGFPIVEFNEDEIVPSVGRHQLAAKGKLRMSSSVAYLRPAAARRDNLRVLTETTATRLILDGSRAVGVETSGGPIMAAREVVLACGVFDTPKLLMLSGIGPGGALQDLGIEVVRDLPAVGQHLLDHPEASVMFEAAQPIPEETTQHFEACLFACSDAAFGPPDLMISFATLPYDMTDAASEMGYQPPEHTVSLTPCLVRAVSEGTVELRSPDPADPPRIDIRYFTDPGGYDERALISGLKIARQIAGQPALAPWVKGEIGPGTQVSSDEALSEYGRHTANTGYHPIGTCRMGLTDADSVVDGRLCVHGMGGLRIADASVFAGNVAVNPVITSMMIGEKCADLLARRDRPGGVAARTTI